MSSNKDLRKQIAGLSDENTEELNNEQLAKLLSELKAKAAEEAEAKAAEEAEAKAAEEAEAKAAEEAEAKAAEAGYEVAAGKSIAGVRGILAPGDEVRETDFSTFEDFETLCEKGYITES